MRRGLGALLSLMTLAPAASLAKPDTAAGLRRASKALKKCTALSVHAHLAEGLEYIEMGRAHGASAERFGDRSDTGWIISVWGGGMGRWASFSETVHVVDQQRCRALIATIDSTASDPTSGVQLKTEGGAAPALHRPLLKHLKAEPGHPTDRRFAFGRLVTRPAKPDQPAVRWIKGKPAAQLKAYWPASPTAGILSASAKAPVPWRSLGRYALWLSDEGRRFRRGRQAIVIYDAEEARHAWVMATPVHEASDGRLAYVGRVGSKAYLTVSNGMGAELYSVDPVAGLTPVGRFETVKVDAANGVRRLTATPMLRGGAEPSVTIVLDP